MFREGKSAGEKEAQKSIGGGEQADKQPRPRETVRNLAMVVALVMISSRADTVLLQTKWRPSAAQFGGCLLAGTQTGVELELELVPVGNYEYRYFSLPTTTKHTHTVLL